MLNRNITYYNTLVNKIQLSKFHISLNYNIIYVDPSIMENKHNTMGWPYWGADQGAAPTGRHLTGRLLPTTCSIWMILLGG